MLLRKHVNLIPPTCDKVENVAYIHNSIYGLCFPFRGKCLPHSHINYQGHVMHHYLFSILLFENPLYGWCSLKYVEKYLNKFYPLLYSSRACVIYLRVRFFRYIPLSVFSRPSHLSPCVCVKILSIIKKTKKQTWRVVGPSTYISIWHSIIGLTQQISQYFS